MNTWRRLLDKLAQQQIRYVLVGGLAVNLHGVPRLTADLDLVLALDPDNMARFLGLMADLGYRPRVPADPMGLADPATRRAWIEEKGMMAFSFWRPETPFADVDVLISSVVPFEELWNHRVLKQLGPTVVAVASIPHLKALKNVAGRKQDLADIEALTQVERLSAPPNPSVPEE